MEEDELCPNCHWQEKIELWWEELKQRDINPFTLEIRDKTLSKEFNALELEQVKKRWELVAIFVVIMTVLTLLASKDDKKKALAFIITVADLVIVFTIVAIIGKKCTSIYYAALPIIVIARCCWATIQVHIVMSGFEPLAESIGLEPFLDSLIVRIFAPCCMIFMINFKTFLCLVLPPTILAIGYINTQTEELYKSTWECPEMLENRDM